MADRFYSYTKGVNKLKLVPIWRHVHILLGKDEKYVEHNQTIVAIPAKIAIFFSMKIQVQRSRCLLIGLCCIDLPFDRLVQLHLTEDFTNAMRTCLED